MSSNEVRCMVCGAPMKKGMIVPTKFGLARKYRCTCGHGEEIKEAESNEARGTEEVLTIEGFQEIP